MASKTFLKSVSATMTVVFIGKALGLIKQAIFATIFGTSIGMDMFFSSYSLVSGVSTALFSGFGIVLLNSYNQEADHRKRSELFSGFLKCSIPVAILLAVLTIVGSKYISAILAPGFDSTNQDELAAYISYLSPIVVLCAVQYPLVAILDSQKKFFAGKALPLILNSSLILAAPLSAYTQNILPLLLATIGSFAIQIAISVFSLQRKAGLIKDARGFKDPRIKRIFMLTLPVLIGNALAEINSITDKSIASELGSGAISAITYAASINEIVTSLIVNTVASVFYSYISSMKAGGRAEEVRKHVGQVIKALCLCLAPISVFVVIFAHHIISALYERGAFGTESVNMTALVVIGYAIGFIPAMISNILAKVHYAFDNTRSPMVSGVVAIILNIVLSITLSHNLGIIGIALATSLSNIVSATMLSITIKKHFKQAGWNRGRRVFIVKFCTAIIGSAIIGTILHNVTTGLSAIIGLILGGLGVLVAFLLILYILGVNVFKEIFRISNIV